MKKLTTVRLLKTVRPISKLDQKNIKGGSSDANNEEEVSIIIDEMDAI